MLPIVSDVKKYGSKPMKHLQDSFPHLHIPSVKKLKMQISHVLRLFSPNPQESLR